MPTYFQSLPEILAFVFGLIGAITTITCFLPQSIKSFITRDTSGLSTIFIISALISSVFWITYGCLIFVYSKELGGLPSALPILLTNIITIGCNAIIGFIKYKNIKESKKLRISEIEYCKNLALAKIKKNTINRSKVA